MCTTTSKLAGANGREWFGTIRGFQTHLGRVSDKSSIRFKGFSWGVHHVHHTGWVPDLAPMVFLYGFPRKTFPPLGCPNIGKCFTTIWSEGVFDKTQVRGFLVLTKRCFTLATSPDIQRYLDPYEGISHHCPSIGAFRALFLVGGVSRRFLWFPMTQIQQKIDPARWEPWIQL